MRGRRRGRGEGRSLLGISTPLPLQNALQRLSPYQLLLLPHSNFGAVSGRGFDCEIVTAASTAPQSPTTYLGSLCSAIPSLVLIIHKGSDRTRKINCNALNMLIKTDEITIRLMQDNMHDYQLMAKWLTDEHVLEFYEGRDNPFTLEKIIEKFKPRVIGDEPVTPCLINYYSNPIGYIQYYSLDEQPESDRQMYRLEQTENVYGIDLFIGETNYWNQGIGTKVLSAVVNYLFEVLQAQKIVIDPHVDNTRAIRCYEKCGFVKVQLLPAHELHEGKYSDSWLMVIDRRSKMLESL